MKILIIGSGFTGAVIAERLALSDKIRKITVLDERNHIGGNSYTERDSQTGIMIHKYGPHIFNTSNLKIWNYINQFDEFYPYRHQVKASYKNSIYSLPINLHTINQFFNKSFSPNEAEAFIKTKSLYFEDPKNFEEQALKYVGIDLYKAFFYGYTKKQWGCEPKEIPATVLKRLPLRFDYNDSYYTSRYVGIPINGYTFIIQKMLSNKKITTILDTKFTKASDIQRNYDHIFYTGPIDFFFDYKFGRLGYRTVTFEEGRISGNYQGLSQMNYPDETVPFTRITEHKYFTPEEVFDQSIYFKEFSKETSENDIPYYPKRLSSDLEKLKLYQNEALKFKKITFIGRLAKYKYMDMHHVIEDAINSSTEFIENLK